MASAPALTVKVVASTPPRTSFVPLNIICVNPAKFVPRSWVTVPSPTKTNVPLLLLVLIAEPVSVLPAPK
ncbi:MAG TPA: hypothetical protein LFV91_03665 [Rickettsia endosymbiont of Bembidion nr. Transversale]|nr:hypothetical protein [Rickettsia endosymbiont of Bembidion nr. Transversale]